MPTKRFTNLQQLGPIAAEVDGNGDVLFPSAASTPAGATEVEGTTDPYGDASLVKPVVIGGLLDSTTLVPVAVNGSGHLLQAILDYAGSQCLSAAVADVVVLLISFGFTENNLNSARRARITAHTAPIMLTYDGSAPTATHGHYLETNATLVLEGNTAINAVRFLRFGALSATVSVTLENISQ